MGTSAGDRRRRISRNTMRHATVAERAALGRAAREAASRSSHATFAPAPDRPDPVALLEGESASRLPEFVPIRYGRMVGSPFAFYRGAALIMASDLAGTPTSGLRVQLCGDAHLANFGMFGTPERRLVFDINDFDETHPGPFEWDVKRLAASLEIAGRSCNLADRRRQQLVKLAVATYRDAIAQFAGMPNLQVYYASLDVDRLIADHRAPVTAKVARNVMREVAKSRTRDSLQAFDRMAQVVDGVPQIVADPPLVMPIREILPAEQAAQFLEWARARLDAYARTLDNDRRSLLARYRLVDAARKVVGVGSVGTRSWIVLLMGRDERDPLFLQLKEAEPSVLEEFLGASEYRNAGQRVVAGQRLMQAASDIFLGWMRVSLPQEGADRDFYVRQLRDWKGGAPFEAMTLEGMQIHARLCGWALARAHACSGDAVAIAAYLGAKDTFDRALAAFATRYADQNERDHAALVDAIATGRIAATIGV